MGQFDKLIIDILSGTNDKDISFNDLCKILLSCHLKQLLIFKLSRSPLSDSYNQVF